MGSRPADGKTRIDVGIALMLTLFAGASLVFAYFSTVLQRASLPGPLLCLAFGVLIGPHALGLLKVKGFGVPTGTAAAGEPYIISNEVLWATEARLVTREKLGYGIEMKMGKGRSTPSSSPHSITSTGATVESSTCAAWLRGTLRRLASLLPLVRWQHTEQEKLQAFRGVE